MFTAPLHYEHENPISKIFYGSGNLEFLAKKYKIGANRLIFNLKY